MSSSNASISTPLNFGSFIPTTNSWDIQQLQQLNIDPQLKELLIRLYQNINNMALVVNSKDTGIYNNQEILTSKFYYPRLSQSSTASLSPNNRAVFRKIIDCGPLPNAGVITIPHNIPVNGGYFFTQIYGTASSGTMFIPLPFVGFIVAMVTQNIELQVTTTDIIITTQDDYSAYTLSSVTLEYIKNY